MTRRTLSNIKENKINKTKTKQKLNNFRYVSPPVFFSLAVKGPLVPNMAVPIWKNVPSDFDGAHFLFDILYPYHLVPVLVRK